MTSPPLEDLAGDFVLDPAYTRLGIVARHAMVTRVHGVFEPFSDRAHLDLTDPTRSRVVVEIEAASVNTGINQREAHLRTSDFFDVPHYPLMTYRASHVDRVGHSMLTVVGWAGLALGDFVLTPLPNTLFQRDNTAWIGTSATVNSMAESVRQRESINTRTVYRHHPLFARTGVDLLLGGDDADHRPAAMEGGDIHVLVDGVVAIGMGERTTPMGAEQLTRALFTGQHATGVLAIELPRSRAAMHLDTLLTMVDRDTFVAYPYLAIDHVRCWLLRPAPNHPGYAAEERTGLPTALEEALGRPMRILTATEKPTRSRTRAVERRRQLPRRRNRRRARLRTQHHHQQPAGPARHRGDRPGRRRARPRRRPLHVLPLYRRSL